MVGSMSDVLDIGFSHTLRDKISRARQNCHWFTIRSFSFPDSIFHLISTDGAKIVKFDRQTDTPGVNCCAPPLPLGGVRLSIRPKSGLVYS